MAAVEDLGELVNKPLADVEAEDPLSKTPASVHPDKNAVGDVLGSALPSKGRGSARERKQVDFFAPQEVKPTEKLVVKEVRAPAAAPAPRIGVVQSTKPKRCFVSIFRVRTTDQMFDITWHTLHERLARRCSSFSCMWLNLCWLRFRARERVLETYQMVNG